MRNPRPITPDCLDPSTEPLRYCPHTVTVYNRATIKGLMYLYYEYHSTVTERGQYPKNPNDNPRLLNLHSQAPVLLHGSCSTLANNMGGCQNYGPFLGPSYNTAPNI